MTAILSRAARIAAPLMLFVSPAAWAQSGEPQPVPVVPEAVTDVDPALWVVRDEDTTIYLFGTIHILKPGLGWFDDGVKAAFDASDSLVIEMVEPPASEAVAIMADLAIDKNGQMLRDKLTADDKAKYEAAVAKLGLSHAQLDPLDPWAAALNLYYAGLFQNGYDPTSGVEMLLSAAAKAKGKPIAGLENMRDQLSIFDGMPADVQLRYVVDTANTLDEIAPQTDRLVQLWSSANTEELASVLNEGFSSLNLTDALLTRRNAKWARWIDERMDRPGTLFLAVGAGHLAGPVSVQQLLKAYGLHAEQIRY
jgi:uncharacterized protein